MKRIVIGTSTLFQPISIGTYDYEAIVYEWVMCSSWLSNSDRIEEKFEYIRNKNGNWYEKNTFKELWPQHKHYFLLKESLRKHEYKLLTEVLQNGLFKETAKPKRTKTKPNSKRNGHSEGKV